MATRGRVQVRWIVLNQTRAGNERDWLTLQLEGRGYVADRPPVVVPLSSGFLVVCNVGFNTVQEGSTVRTLASSRQTSSPMIEPGSFYIFHECPHDDGTNDCSSTLEKVVKT